jgi:hypothetical protein
VAKRHTSKVWPTSGHQKKHALPAEKAVKTHVAAAAEVNKIFIFLIKVYGL